MPKSHQQGVAVVEEDSEPEEQEKNLPIIDSTSQEVEGSGDNEDAVLAAKKMDGCKATEPKGEKQRKGKSRAAQLIDELHPGDVSGKRRKGHRPVKL